MGVGPPPSIDAPGGGDVGGGATLVGGGGQLVSRAVTEPSTLIKGQ